jgi:hypothetical protein
MTVFYWRVPKLKRCISLNPETSTACGPVEGDCGLFVPRVLPTLLGKEL